jgi:hypothetical protein
MAVAMVVAPMIVLQVMVTHATLLVVMIVLIASYYLLTAEI